MRERLTLIGLLAAVVPAGALAAQMAMPPIGIVDFYGRRTVPERALLEALRLGPGDSLPPIERWPDVTRRVEGVPGVLHATLTPVCCAEGRTILFVGIVERGAPSLTFRPAPTDSVPLPDDVREAGETFSRAFDQAIEAQDFAEDISAGHSLMHFPAARAAQERFVALAARRLDTLRAVLRRSASAADRALATQIIAYLGDKRAVVPDLVFAAGDPDGGTRNNAIRALGVIASYADAHPALGIEVPFGPLLALLDSPVWTDRNKASFALFGLTASRDPALLDALRRELPALTEMARWRSRGHAHAAFLILGRMGGLPDSVAERAWTRNDPDAVIGAARRARPERGGSP